MKFKVKIEFEYPVDVEGAQATYGTTDVEEMTKIDKESLEDPALLIEQLENRAYSVTVEPVNDD